jgi:tetratricopeptide (TPR) repeat protein
MPRNLTPLHQQIKTSGSSTGTVVERESVAMVEPNAKVYAINPWFLGAAIVACLSLAAAFIPKQTELVARLMHDGEKTRAIRLAAAEGEQIILKAIDAPEDSNGIDESVVEERFRFLLQQQPTPSPTELVWAIKNFQTPRKAMALLNKHQAALDNPRLYACYSAAADLALAHADPSYAASLCKEAARLGLRDEPMLRKELQALIWSNQSVESGELLLSWAEEHTLPADLNQQRIALLRAVNQPALALEAMLPGLAQPNVDQEQLLTAIKVAANAGAVAKVAPFVEKALAKFSETTASITEIAKGQVPITPQWQELAFRYAQGCEWNAHPHEAFDLYLKLAASGNRDALDRVLVLGIKQGLNRKGDVMGLLKEICPLADRPELEAQAAQLMADSGRYEEALLSYKRWLEKNPQDLKAWSELAAVYDEMSLMDKALATHEHILSLDPNYLPSRKEKADLLIGLRDFRGALAVYKKFTPAEHDPFTLENYALLAESLADYAGRADALGMRQRLLLHPTSKDFYDVARAYIVLEQYDTGISLLHEGMKKHPNSRLLWLTLARAYGSADRGDEALVLLERPEIRSDMEALMIYIETAATRMEYEKAYNFLGNGIEKQFAFGPETMLPLSVIYFHNNRKNKADQLLADVKPEPSLFSLLAKTHFQRAEYSVAETYQRSYLDRLQLADAPGWMFLGDLCKAQGKKEQADEAYHKGLLLMAQKMHNASDTAAANFTPAQH